MPSPGLGDTLLGNTTSVTCGRGAGRILESSASSNTTTTLPLQQQKQQQSAESSAASVAQPLEKRLSSSSTSSSVSSSKVMSSSRSTSPRMPSYDEQYHVSIRICPNQPGEENVLNTSDGKVAFKPNKLKNATQAYSFDHVFDSSEAIGASQKDIFDRIGKKVLEHAWEGFNSSVLAYGQTGSGKTYTMIGEAAPEEEEGLMPRICRRLLEMVEDKKAGRCSRRSSSSSRSSSDSAEEEEEEDSCCQMPDCRHSKVDTKLCATKSNGRDDEEVTYKIEVRYLEVYMDEVCDLLASSENKGKKLKVREQPDKSTHVPDAVVREVSTWEEMKSVIEVGGRARRVGSTQMNPESSRSHAIFCLDFTQITTKKCSAASEDPVRVRKSKICMVDLAGSERSGRDGSSVEQRKQGSAINVSLTALNRCIMALSGQEKENNGKGGGAANGRKNNPVVPYRDSQLTFLLKESLGGNAKTFMLATISPSIKCADETLSTLKYAATASKVITHTHVNEKEDASSKKIRELQDVIKGLQQQLSSQSSPQGRLGDDDLPPPPHIMPLPPPSNDEKALEMSVHKSAALDALPYLIRLFPDDMTSKRKKEPTHYELESKDTDFDEDGEIIDPFSSRSVAFTLSFNPAEKKISVKVPRGRQLFVNGTPFQFGMDCKQEVWDGTRLAISPTQLFLLRYPGAVKSTIGKMTGDALKHQTLWDVLEDHPACYWQAAQAEVSRRDSLTMHEAETLCRTGRLPGSSGDDDRATFLSSPVSASGFSNVTSGSEDGDDDINAPTSMITPQPSTCSTGSSVADRIRESRPGATSSAGASGLAGRHDPVGRLPRLSKAMNKSFGAQANVLPPPAQALTSPVPFSLGSPASSLNMPSTSARMVSGTGGLGQRMGTPVTPVESLLESSDMGSTTHMAAPSVSRDPRTFTSRTVNGSDQQYGLPPRISDARDLKARFDSVEATLCSQAVKDLANTVHESVHLVHEIMRVMPKLVQANALAQASNKPVSFYFDVVPRSETSVGTKLNQSLQYNGQSPLAAELGAILENDNAYVLPAAMEVSHLEPTIIIRARNALNDSVHDMSIVDFEDAVKAMKIARAKPEGPFPLIEGFNPHQQPHISSQYASPVPAAAAPGGYHGRFQQQQYSPAGIMGREEVGHPDLEIDPYFFEGEDSVLGRSDVYLSSLLDDKNVIGDFPLLSPVDGSCLGTVHIRLLPVDRLSEDSKEPYYLTLKIESITLEKGELTNLVEGSNGTWNRASAVSALNPQVMRYPGEDPPQLKLRFQFWDKENVHGEVNVSSKGAGERAPGGRSVASTQKSYSINETINLAVSSISRPFLNYLATGALHFDLCLSKDSVDKLLWQRYQQVEQRPSQRCLALSAVYPLDIGIEPVMMDDPRSVIAGSVLHVQSVATRRSARPGSVIGAGNRRSMRIDTTFDHDFEDIGDTFSVMGDLDPIAYDTCASLNLRMNRFSLRKSQSTRHSDHFFANLHKTSSCFMFMAVDVLEPILQPGIDYFSEVPTQYAPVDIKPLPIFRRHRRAPVRNAAAQQPQQQLQQISQGYDNDSVSEMGDDGASVAYTQQAPVPAEEAPIYPGLEKSGAQSVFHIMCNPLIRMRQLKIVLEQLDPAAPMLLESCLHVRASSYVSIYAKEYQGDIQEHANCDADLNVVKVTRSACRKRLELTVEMPTSQILCERSRKGERIVLMLEISAYMDGFAEPIKINRDVVMKVIPPERKKTMMYTLRKNLKEPVSDRFHQVGTYYVVKCERTPQLQEVITEFVDYKLKAHGQLIQRMELARRLQEGRGPSSSNNGKQGSVRPQPETFDSWREALKSVGNDDTKATATQKQGGGNDYQKDLGRHHHTRHHAPATPDTMDRSPYRHRDHDGEHDSESDRESEIVRQQVKRAAEVIISNERKAALKALFGVDCSLEGPDGRKGEKGGRRMKISDSSIDNQTQKTLTYTYPARGMGDHAKQELDRKWDTLSKVTTEEVMDYPTQREGFLNLRTGLLGAQSTRLWCVWRRPFLYIYKAKNGTAPPMDVVHVTDCKVAYGKDELDFEIRGPQKTWFFQAAGEEDFTAWITKLGQQPLGASGGNDYFDRNSLALIPSSSRIGEGGGGRASQRMQY